MDKLEMVQVALREPGDVSSQELAGFIERRFQVKIEAKFIPLFTASLRDKLRLEAAGQAARAVAETDAGKSPDHPSRLGITAICGND